MGISNAPNYVSCIMNKALTIALLLCTAIVHAQQTFTDTHNDALSSQLLTRADLGKQQVTGCFDLVRARQGRLTTQVFSVWCGAQYRKGRGFGMANRQIDSLYALAKRYPDAIAIVHNVSGLNAAHAQGKLAALIGVEGGHMIEDRLDYIDSLAHRGMRYLTLTWNNSTSWATSAKDETLKPDSLPHKGLTAFGKLVVQRLNHLGVMIDVSHVGEQTFYDALATSTKPVIASHSCAYALCPFRRNLKDAQLLALAKNGGVVFVNFYSGFIDSTYLPKQAAFQARHRAELDSLIKACNDEDIAIDRLNKLYPAETEALRAPLSMLLRHIDYIVKLIGIDHVGLGSDFDGSESAPLGLDDVRDYHKITDGLQALGYTATDIEKICNGNFIRVLKANGG